MRSNRSVPPCPVIPNICYPDPASAADWLVATFDFTVRLRIGNHRIQMLANDGCFTIREGSELPNQACFIQVRIEDALRHCERARKAGARILAEPMEYPYGERQYDAQDFYGHRWNVTETLRDVDPQTWGGTLPVP